MGADPNLKNIQSLTPMHLAFRKGNSAIIMSLIEAGGDLNRLNNNNQTPLAYGDKSLLKELALENGIASIL